MKKGLLGLLLIFPFLIAFLAFTTSDYLIKGVEQDIADIEIDYPALAPFGLKEGKQKLQANAIFNQDYPLSEGNEIVFSVPEDQDVARIDKEEDGYYLVPLSEGQVEVTVSNLKGNVSRRFTAVVYGETGALIVNLDFPFSTAGMESYYWGTKDIEYASIDSPYSKKQAVIDFEAAVYGNESMDIYDFNLEYSDNLAIDLSKEQIKVLTPGESFIRFIHPFSTTTPPTEIVFTAVEAVNIYSYADLLKATNLSENGEAVVLHVNLESQANFASLSNKNHYDIFGNIAGTVNPEAYVYDFETTYNHDFIDGWNAGISFKVSKEVHTGIRLRQSLYGNGFLINGHDLCYPSSSSVLSDGTVVPVLSPSDLYRGPRIYTAVGDPASPYENNTDGVEPLLVLYGQDNSLLYVDGDGVTVDNIRLRNADFGNNYQNLITTGIGIDVNGDRTVISNSVISSARSLIRTYSSDITIENCLLQNALEYGIKAGANEFNRVDPNKQITYSDDNGNKQTTTVSNYVTPIDLANPTAANMYSGKADSILSAGVLTANQANVFISPFIHFLIDRDHFTIEEMASGAQVVQDAMTNTTGFVNEDGSKEYAAHVEVKNCFFYNCHVSSISLDSYYNGPFLYNNISTMFYAVLGNYIDYFPKDGALTMAPTELTLSGDNRFYTYQKLSDLSFDSLLTHDIDTFIKVHGGVSSIQADVTEDDYLPLRQLIGQTNQALYSNNGVNYVNTPIMKMGGGTNLSDVVFEHDSLGSFSVNCYEHVLARSATMVPDNQFMGSDEAKYSTMKVALSRAASNVMGFEDYTFYTLDMAEHPYFGETPSLSELSARS